jgi:predicted transcriptional regulator
LPHRGEQITDHLLKGLGEAIDTEWPQAVIQTCGIHLLGNTFNRHQRRPLGNQTSPPRDCITKRPCGGVGKGDERDMAKLKRLGDLERAVRDQLWDTGGPQTVRQVHDALCAQRELAYTTVMTVLHRLACKNLVVQIREDRAYQYAPTHGRDELVAALMVDVLDQVADRGGRHAALMRFVGRVGADEADALRRALAEAGSLGPGRGDDRRHTRGRELAPAARQELLNGLRR